MTKEKPNECPELWGGIECSINRVGDQYMDQCELSGHYKRSDDIDRIAQLGIKSLRYPILWERHIPNPDQSPDWTIVENNLEKLQVYGIKPIAGLVHHGSGPRHTSFYDDSFAEGLASFAGQVARKFPWIEYYTPVNEPLTTARFCGLYGHWYPHGQNPGSFLKVLLSECKAIVLSMREIRKINPIAKLVFTEDLAKTHATAALQYQADYENERRWLSIDLICGKVNETHCLHHYLVENGITQKEVDFFLHNACPPDILGFNHYVTSERFIDEEKGLYPSHTWGGNGMVEYADVEAVRVDNAGIEGPYCLLKEAWQRFGLPMAVTEVHLHCTREEQLRWFNYVWNGAKRLKAEGIDVRAVTAWALLGSYDWCSLLTRQRGEYEPGVFDLREVTPRATALASLIKSLAAGKTYKHPVMDNHGWWERNCRIIYRHQKQQHVPAFSRRPIQQAPRPLIITTDKGTIGEMLTFICHMRGIHFIALNTSGQHMDHPVQLLRKHDPWALLDTHTNEGPADRSWQGTEDRHYEIETLCEQSGIRHIDIPITTLNGSSDNLFHQLNNLLDCLIDEECGMHPVTGSGRLLAMPSEQVA